MVIGLLLLVMASIFLAIASVVILVAYSLLVIYLIDELDKRCGCSRSSLGYEHKGDGSCCAHKKGIIN